MKFSFEKSRVVVVASLVLGGTLGLGACTADSLGVSSTPLPTLESSIAEIPVGTGIAKGVTLDASTSEPGTTVTASGTVIMPEDLKGDAAISVSWVNSTTSTVYVRSVTIVEDLKPGERHSWSVTAELPADAEDVQIVLGAVKKDDIPEM